MKSNEEMKQYTKGCNCKKSSCRQKYCECFKTGVACSDLCHCQSCENTFGKEARSNSSTFNSSYVYSAIPCDLYPLRTGASNLSPAYTTHSKQRDDFSLPADLAQIEQATYIGPSNTDLPIVCSSSDKKSTTIREVCDALPHLPASEGAEYMDLEQVKNMILRDLYPSKKVNLSSNSGILMTVENCAMIVQPSQQTLPAEDPSMSTLNQLFSTNSEPYEQTEFIDVHDIGIKILKG